MIFISHHPFLCLLGIFVVIGILSYCSHLCDVQIAKIISKNNTDIIKTNASSAALELFLELKKYDVVIGSSTITMADGLTYIFVLLREDNDESRIVVPKTYKGFEVRTTVTGQFFMH